MITPRRKIDCCGCTACASICPKQCITMETDEEGFIYPKVNNLLCVDCGVCEQVCPILHPGQPRVPVHCYAAINKDHEVLNSSSSGGVFSLLSQYVIGQKDGCVFGAIWDGDHVVHGYTDSLDNVSMFRGSKYVQSDLRDTFKQALGFLKQGRFVLFTGTPCEVAGFRSFLKKEYDNLLTVDLACHGVPSPKVLALYISELKHSYGVESIRLNFRDKVTGWSDYSISARDGSRLLFTEKAKVNIYMKGFLNELFSRPSCHECPFRGFSSGSDITLGDFWGIRSVLPEMSVEGGVSLVLTHTRKGEGVFKMLEPNVNLKEVTYKESVANNASLVESVSPHPKRDVFFRRIERKGSSFSREVSRIIELSFFQHFILRVKRAFEILFKLG